MLRPFRGYLTRPWWNNYMSYSYQLLTIVPRLFLRESSNPRHYPNSFLIRLRIRRVTKLDENRTRGRPN